MLLRNITIKNLRLLRDLTVPFEYTEGPKRGQSRQWTVFIGRNGTGKTSILQAIALAAAGNAGAIKLSDKVREQLPDARSKEESRIRAEFSFGPIGRDHGERPLKTNAKPDGLHVEVTIPRGKYDPLSASSWYSDQNQPTSVSPNVENDPLVNARENNLNHWFVAGYGMHRYATEWTHGSDGPRWFSIDRLRPLFETVPIIGPNFIEILSDVKSPAALLPGIVDFELRGQGGVKYSADVMERNRFSEQIGQKKQKFPATWFAHGHQSTLVWLSDLIGNVLLEAKQGVEPSEMEGTVLIDEIDLYLHPTWQVHFINALRVTFPNLQFIATTHSPILLTGLCREEVIILERDDGSGDVQWRHPSRDPRLLTGTELYEEFFEIHKLYPTDLAQVLNEYRILAMNPFRPAGQDARIAELRQKLELEGIPVLDPVDRENEAAE
jgi:energy-coupling factor transporter ATP-binding protein EcfA2